MYDSRTIIPADDNSKNNVVDKAGFCYVNVLTYDAIIAGNAGFPT